MYTYQRNKATKEGGGGWESSVVNFISVSTALREGVSGEI